MKLAVAGKGGSGKTSISGTMARLLARGGHDVLAIDGDSNPNLAMTLGIPVARVDELPTMPREVVRRTEAGAELTGTLEEIREAHALTGPDGVQLLIMAHPQHAGTGCFCAMHAAVRSVIAVAGNREGEVCILDTEATPEHLARGTASHADMLVAVVEPYFKSLETGRRMIALARDLGIGKVALVANKVRDEGDEEAIRRFAEAEGLQVAGVVPFDERLPEAERERTAPMDFAPDAPAIRAIGELADALVAGNGGSPG